jgi:hypothetical protein
MAENGFAEKTQETLRELVPQDTVQEDAEKAFVEIHGGKPGDETFYEGISLGFYDTKYDIWAKKRKAFIKNYKQKARMKAKYGDMNIHDFMDPNKFMGETQFGAQGDALSMLHGLVQTDPEQFRGVRTREVYDAASKAALAEQQRAMMSGFMPGGAAAQASLMAPAQAQLETGLSTLESQMFQEQIQAAVSLSDAIGRNIEKTMGMMEFNDKVTANVISTMNQAISDLAAAGVLGDVQVADAVNQEYEAFWESIINGMDPQQAADTFNLNVKFLYSK